MSLNCPGCGAAANPTARFCMGCGAELPAVGVPSKASSPLPDLPPLATSSITPPTAGGEIVVEVEANRRHVHNHASLLRLRVTNNLDGACGVTVCLQLYEKGGFVEQDRGEIEQCCQFHRRGDQRVFSFPFRGLLPGAIAVRELWVLLSRSEGPDAPTLLELPDQSLLVQVSDPAMAAQSPGIVVSGGINLDFSQLKEMYGADIRNVLNLSASREPEPGHAAAEWVPILLRVVEAGERAGCGFAGCGRPVVGRSAFGCERCEATMCRKHRDDDKPAFCKRCAEDVRAEEFEKARERLTTRPQEDRIAGARGQITQARAPFEVRIWAEPGVRPTTRDLLTVPRDSKGAFRLGDQFTLNVQTERDGYLTLLNIGTSGNVYQLLADYPLRAGPPSALSGPDAGRQWKIGGPPGVERLQAVFSLEPVRLFPEAASLSLIAAAGRNAELIAHFEAAGAILGRLPSDSWTDASCEFVVLDT